MIRKTVVTTVVLVVVAVVALCLVAQFWGSAPFADFPESHLSYLPR
jgi:hypothetical protein